MKIVLSAIFMTFFLGVTAIVNADGYNAYNKLIVLTEDDLAGNLTIKTDAYMTDISLPAGIYMLMSKNGNPPIGLTFKHDGEIVTVPKGDYYIIMKSTNTDPN